MAGVENETLWPKVPLSSPRERNKKAVLQLRASGVLVFFVL